MAKVVLNRGMDYYIFEQLGTERTITEKKYNLFCKEYFITVTKNVDATYGNAIYTKLVKCGYKRVEED